MQKIEVNIIDIITDTHIEALSHVRRGKIENHKLVVKLNKKGYIITEYDDGTLKIQRDKDYIQIAESESFRAIYNIMQEEIEKQHENIIEDYMMYLISINKITPEEGAKVLKKTISKTPTEKGKYIQRKDIKWYRHWLREVINQVEKNHTFAYFQGDLKIEYNKELLAFEKLHDIDIHIKY